MTAMNDPRLAAQVMAEQCLCFRSRWIARALTRLYDEALRPLRLQATQLTLLNAISVLGRQDGGGRETVERTDGGVQHDAAAAPGVPMNRLSEILALDPTTLSRNLRRLERDGLIRIRPAPDDRRVMLVSLTPEGEQPIADAFPLWTRAQERVAEAPGPEFTASLLDDFEAVMAADPFDPAHDGSC